MSTYYCSHGYGYGSMSTYLFLYIYYPLLVDMDPDMAPCLYIITHMEPYYTP